LNPHFFFIPFPFLKLFRGIFLIEKMSLYNKNKKSKTNHIKYIPGKLQISKRNPQAEFPSRAHPTDVGYDITLIGRENNRSEDATGEVNVFLTGISVTPPPGHYVEMVPRSSLHKQGYMLANNVGIIDPSYTGEVKVALYKFKDCDDLKLPIRAVQLIIRPAIYAHIASVTTMSNTNRGSGGFGSTGFTPFNQQNFQSNNKQVYQPSFQNANYAASSKQNSNNSPFF